MRDNERTLDMLNRNYKALQESGKIPQHKESSSKCEIPVKRRTTLHKRDVTKDEYYIVARFIFALMHVKVPKYKIPLLLDLGTKALHLPVWYKTGEGWQLADYGVFSREALGLPVPMMRAISRKLSIGENHILNALHSLSIISVDMLTRATEGPRRYCQTIDGILVNPINCQPLNCQPLNYQPMQNMRGFMLDKKRVQEWIQKELKKRAERQVRQA